MTFFFGPPPFTLGMEPAEEKKLLTMDCKGTNHSNSVIIFSWGGGLRTMQWLLHPSLTTEAFHVWEGACSKILGSGFPFT